jgi:putative hydrolase of the HAD superfamily
MSKIKNVVFDVGMVLVDFRWRALMADLGFDPDLIEKLGKEMIMSEGWKRMDRGEWDEDEAPDYYAGRMPEYADRIKAFWDNKADVVREFDYAEPMIRKLKAAGYKVYLLSNYPLKLSKLHWPTFTFINEVDGWVISAEEKLVKPDPKIYERLMDKYGLEPEESIFLDDLSGNVEAAKKLGIHGIVFKNYNDALLELKKEGVEIE